MPGTATGAIRNDCRAPASGLKTISGSISGSAFTTILGSIAGSATIANVSVRGTGITLAGTPTPGAAAFGGKAGF